MTPPAITAPTGISVATVAVNGTSHINPSGTGC